MNQILLDVYAEKVQYLFIFSEGTGKIHKCDLNIELIAKLLDINCGGAVIFTELAYILASLRGSSFCLFSGCYGGAIYFSEFAYILASLQGSSFCLFSGCCGGAVIFKGVCLYSGVAAGQQPLSIFWLLWRSGYLH